MDGSKSGKTSMELVRMDITHGEIESGAVNEVEDLAGYTNIAEDFPQVTNLNE